MKSRDPRAGDDFPALLPNQSGQRLTHGRIVGDAFLRNVNRRDAARMRLDLTQFFAVEHTQAGQAVLASAFEQRRCSRGTSSSLAATTTLPHTSCGMPCVWQNSTIWPDAAHGQAGALRSRLVVQTAVQHAAVVAALMEGHRALLFEDGDAGAGNPLL